MLTHFVRCWLSYADSIMLSASRKLACVALTSLLATDAALLALVPEVLSFCVSVLAELDELPRPQRSEQSTEVAVAAVGSSGTLPSPMSGEHAEFTRRLQKFGFDPFPSMRLLPTLRDGVSRVSAVHGDSVAMHILDPVLLEQVSHVFGELRN